MEKGVAFGEVRDVDGIFVEASQRFQVADQTQLNSHENRTMSRSFSCKIDRFNRIN